MVQISPKSADMLPNTPSERTLRRYILFSSLSFLYCIFPYPVEYIYIYITLLFCYLPDIEKERKKREGPEAMEEDVTDEEVYEIKPAHFEESMKFAR